MITHEEITCQSKFLEKMGEKSLFLQIFLTNLQEKSHVIWKFLVVWIYNFLLKHHISSKFIFNYLAIINFV